MTSLGFVVSGEKLLERYGMTETGMVVSNPLQGMCDAHSFDHSHISVIVHIAAPVHCLDAWLALAACPEAAITVFSCSVCAADVHHAGAAEHQQVPTQYLFHACCLGTLPSGIQCFQSMKLLPASLLDSQYQSEC